MPTAELTVTAVDVGPPFYGWGGTAWLGHEPWDTYGASVATWGPLAHRFLVHDMGFTDLRLNLPAGVESDADYYQTAWDANDKPIWTTKNWAAMPTDEFYWSSLDKSVEYVVGPIRSLILARGRTPRLVLHSHCGGNNSNPSFYDSTADDIGGGVNGRQKAAVRIVEAFKHLWTTYGWIPDGIDLVNEPDGIPAWTSLRLSPRIWTSSRRSMPTWTLCLPFRLTWTSRCAHERRRVLLPQ